MDKIKIYDKDNNLKEYKVLLIIDLDYKYIIYTNINNSNLEKDLLVAKVKSLDNINETLEISDEEWKMIEERYQKIIKNARNE